MAHVEDNFKEKLRTYTICLEDSIKEAQRYNLKIPDDDLSSFNDCICSHLSIDKNGPRVMAVFEAARELNENFIGNKSLTFVKSKCEFHRGRYSHFKVGCMKNMKSVGNYDCIPGKINILKRKEL